MVGFFSDPDEMEEDEMEDFMDACIDLKPRVSGNAVGLKGCKGGKFLVQYLTTIYFIRQCYYGLG